MTELWFSDHIFLILSKQYHLKYQAYLDFCVVPPWQQNHAQLGLRIQLHYLPSSITQKEHLVIFARFEHACVWKRTKMNIARCC
jgi:hypothetical protein